MTGSRRGGKRGNGEGTVYQRADGRWEGAAVVPVAGGGRARRRVYGRTRQETSAKLTALLRQAEQGIAAPVAGQTVAGYLAGWLADTAKRHLRPPTYETYELLSRRHIVPLVGAKRLDRLTAADIRRLLNAKSDEGLSASTVRQLHAVLRVALQQAVRDDLLPRNVARLVQVPVACPDPVQPLDLDDARQLLETARGGRLYALWAVAIGVGLSAPAGRSRCPRYAWRRAEPWRRLAGALEDVQKVFKDVQKVFTRTMPCPIPPEDRHRVRDAHFASPMPPPPAGPPRSNARCRAAAASRSATNASKSA